MKDDRLSPFTCIRIRVYVVVNLMESIVLSAGTYYRLYIDKRSRPSLRMRPSLGGTGAPNIFLKGLRGSFDCVSEHCEGFLQTLLGFSTDDITLTALREESKPKAELLPFPVVINDNLKA